MQIQPAPDEERRRDTLWMRLRDFRIGDAADAYTFEQRLARENNWSLEHALQVMEEYRRFLYLIAVSERPLTPSDAVDQAWHLHLAYTRSYWHELCRDILGFELHHNPTKGGTVQQAHFKACYAATLDRYVKIFGTSPPQDIWPDVQQRFAADHTLVRIDRSRVWLMAKPRPATALLAAGLLMPMLISACTPGEGESSLWYWVKVAIGIGGVIMLGVLISKHLGGAGGPGGHGSGCGSGCAGSGCCGGGGD